MKLKLTKKDLIYIIVIFVLICAIVAISVMWAVTSKEKKQQEYYEKKCYSFEVQNANLSKGQIIFIGDSITDLYPLDNYYTDLLLATYNRGIGGDTTDGVLKRLEVSLFALQPTEVVLMIGVNDIGGGKTNGEILVNYDAILKSIKSILPNAKVFCMSVLPINETMTGSTSKTDERNRQIMELDTEIAQMVSRYNYTYVDLFSKVADGNNRLIAAYSDDGIHLNAAGFAVWTDILKKLL